MNITTYHSVNAPVHKAWIAYPCIDGLELCRCEAATEAEAIARAEKWYAKESVKQARIVGDSEEDHEPSTFNRAMGKGHHFEGKVWMLHRDTVQRKRVAQKYVIHYQANGWIKAGPRSK